MDSEKDKSRDTFPTIQISAEFQCVPLPSGHLVQVSGLQFRNDRAPLRDGARSEIQGAGCDRGLAFVWVEVRQNVFFEHALAYSMLYANANYAHGEAVYAVPMETMGERIRTLRQARGWSQGQLADRVGVTTGAVSHWENGATKNIKLQTFLSLCSELATTPHYLIWGPAKPSPAPSRRQA